LIPANLPAVVRVAKRWLPTEKKKPCLKFATPEDRASSLRALEDWIASDKKAGKRREYAYWLDKEGLVFIDIDKCVENGKIIPAVLELIAELKPTYIEFSQSGTGIHLLCRGVLPQDFSHTKPKELPPGFAFPYNVEIFSGNIPNRVAGLTGKRIGDSSEIGNLQSAVESLLEKCKAALPAGTATASELPIIDEKPAEEEKPDLPPFPKFVGPLHEIAEAITNDLAYEHKILAELCYVGCALSGKIAIEHLQPRFYGCMVGPAGFGKTAVDKEVWQAIHPLFPHLYTPPTCCESQQSLVETLATHPHLMLAPDEISILLTKDRARMGNAAILGEVLKLYERNDTGRIVIKRTKTKPGEQKTDQTIVQDAHLGIFGGCTTVSFENVWCSKDAAASGLQTRFCLSYSEQIAPRVKTATDLDKLASALDYLKNAVAGVFNCECLPQYFFYSYEAQAMLHRWRPLDYHEVTQRHSPRILDMAKRVALLVSATQANMEIDEEAMEIGLRFADYQIALKDWLMPEDVSSYVEKFEKRIRKYVQKHGPCSRRTIETGINPGALLGGYECFNRAWRALERQLRKVATNRAGQPVYRWE
jgi:hypothetical protein